VTHKGRSADSGHYISWVRKREADASAPYNAWLRFDDDSVRRGRSGKGHGLQQLYQHCHRPLRPCPLHVRPIIIIIICCCWCCCLLQVSEVDTEYITSHLKGGGDDHMAYLLFYKAKA